jgi:copper chaperone CopZ
MNYLIPSTLLAAALLAPCPAFAAGPAPAQRGSIPAAAEVDGAKYIVTIEGMMCGDCQKKVKDALEKMDGVAKVDVVWEKGTAEVTLKDPNGVLTLDDVKKALADFKEFTVKEVKKA